MVDTSPFFMLPEPGTPHEREYQQAWGNLDTTTWGLIQAQFSSGLRTNPVTSLNRDEEIDRLMTATKPNPALYGGGHGGPGNTNTAPRRVYAPEYDSPVLSIQDANAKYGVKNGEEDLLSFSEPTREKAAKYLHDLKMAELRDTDYAIRARGFWKNTAGLGAGFVASAIDPINIGASLIPVAAPLRAAMLARGFGLGITRLVAGGLEGAAGAALVEPLVYSSAQKAHLDYGLDDSLMNMAFGTLLGGGLHYVGGKMGDFLNKVNYDTRLNLLRTAVNQAMSERPVGSMEALLSADRKVFDAGNAKSSEISQSTLQLFEALGDNMPQVDFAKGMRFVPGAPDRTKFRFSEEKGDFHFEGIQEQLNKGAKDNERVDMHLQGIDGPQAREIILELRRLGLRNKDIERAAAGVETLALITKDKVVKITNGDFGEEFPGLTAKVLFSRKIGGHTIEVAERVKTIEDIIDEKIAGGDKRSRSEIREAESRKLRQELAFELGIRRLVFGDDHAYNIGRQFKDDKAVILDRGGGAGIGPQKVKGEQAGVNFIQQRGRPGNQEAIANWVKGFKQADNFQPPVSGKYELDQAYFEHLNELALAHQYDPNEVPKIWGFGDEEALITLKPEPLAKDAADQLAQLDESVNNIKELLGRFGLDKEQLGRLEEQANKPVKFAQKLRKGIQQAAACVAGAF